MLSQVFFDRRAHFRPASATPNVCLVVFVDDDPKIRALLGGMKTLDAVDQDIDVRPAPGSILDKLDFSHWSCRATGQRRSLFGETPLLEKVRSWGLRPH